FGLARLVDHGLAGTIGYLAPECVTTGKTSKESDVYSFGIIALEIACGRRPEEPAEQPNKVRLVEWVWDLFGRRAILEAAYEKLHGNFDEEPWVAHGCRAVVCSSGLESAAIDEAGNLETPLPQLPPKMPVPMYCMPSADEIQSLDTSLEVK
ncbi:unnamed protein product, partial [Musa acuminata subsp. burmannicoides]